MTVTARDTEERQGDSDRRGSGSDQGLGLRSDGFGVVRGLQDGDTGPQLHQIDAGRTADRQFVGHIEPRCREVARTGNPQGGEQPRAAVSGDLERRVSLRRRPNGHTHMTLADQPDPLEGIYDRYPEGGRIVPRLNRHGNVAIAEDKIAGRPGHREQPHAAAASLRGQSRGGQIGRSDSLQLRYRAARGTQDIGAADRDLARSNAVEPLELRPDIPGCGRDRQQGVVGAIGEHVGTRRSRHDEPAFSERGLLKIQSVHDLQFGERREGPVGLDLVPRGHHGRAVTRERLNRCFDRRRGGRRWNRDIVAARLQHVAAALADHREHAAGEVGLGHRGWGNDRERGIARLPLHRRRGRSDDGERRQVAGVDLDREQAGGILRDGDRLSDGNAGASHHHAHDQPCGVGEAANNGAGDRPTDVPGRERQRDGSTGDCGGLRQSDRLLGSIDRHDRVAERRERLDRGLDGRGVGRGVDRDDGRAVGQHVGAADATRGHARGDGDRALHGISHMEQRQGREIPLGTDAEHAAVDIDRVAGGERSQSGFDL